MNKKNLFVIIAIFWLVIIGGFVAYKEFTLKTGDEILLKTLPVDPRDLFRGDYVILRYEIGTINASKPSYQDFDFEEGDKIYTLLSIDDDNIATMTDISKNKPEDGKFLKGTIKGVSSNNRLTIEYGIESYFVPEGEGKAIEKNIRRDEVYVKVAVDDFGNAVIKSLILDGEKITF
jgi:uncharacterized membrane-anchored protein